MEEKNDHQINIVIADDHTILADGIANLLNKNERFHVVGTAENGEKVISFLKVNRVDIVILDINMPVMDGIETTQIIYKHFPKTKVLIMSMHNKEGYIQNALDAGADGYILKNTSYEEMVRAIDRVVSGESYFSQDVSSSMAMKMRRKTTEEVIKLSKIEKQLLTMLSEGKTSDEISATMATSSHTISSYRRNMLVKFNAKNVTQLIAIALKKGYIK